MCADRNVVANYDTCGQVRMTAAKAQLSEDKVRSILRAHGRPLPGRSRKIDESRAICLYNKHKVIRRVSEQMGASVGVITRCLLRNNIPLRHRMSTIDVKKIAALRSDNLTWTQIARLTGISVERMRIARQEGRINKGRYIKKYDKNKIISQHRRGVSSEDIAIQVKCKASQVRNLLVRWREIQPRPKMKPVDVVAAKRLLDKGWTIRHICKKMRVSYARLRRAMEKSGWSHKRSNYKPIDLQRSLVLSRQGYHAWMIAHVFKCSREHVIRCWKAAGIDPLELKKERYQTTRTYRRALRLNFIQKHEWKAHRKPTMILGMDVTKHAVNSVRVNGHVFFVSDYPDIEALKIITRGLRNPYYGLLFPKNEYDRFVYKHYHSARFRCLLNAWRNHGRNKWYLPSLDHKTPLSRGGKHVLANTQYVTRFENMVKMDRTVAEWKKFCEDTKTSSKLFIREKAL